MAKASHLLYLLFLSSFSSIFCPCTAVGTKLDVSSTVKALSTTLNVKQVGAFQFQVLVSDQGVVHSLSSTGSKAHLRSHTLIPETPTVVVSCSSLNGLEVLLPVLVTFAGSEKVSVALPLSLLKSMNTEQKTHVDDVLHHLRKSKSFLVVKESVDGDWNSPDELIQSITLKANLVGSLLSHAHVPIILSIESSVLPVASEVSSFNGKSIFIQVSPSLKLPSRRELLTHFNPKNVLHDSLYPPSTIPTSPVFNPTTPVTNPPYNPTPTVVTVPGTNPVTPPSSAAFPYTTPVPVTPAGNPVAPIPDPGTQPVTNPVTTYPPQVGVAGVPSTTSPVTTPVTTPAVAGQSWCIAKNGAPETALQSALDYACGIGGADCATIQEGASCYNPNTLENHASYAFNSYYQKNPTATSCDFGGAAVIVNSNPSSGTCVYPSSATTAAPSIMPPATTAAPSTIPPATTASTSGDTGAGTGTGSSYGSPPYVQNSSSSPTSSATGYGFETPPMITAPPSGSAHAKTTLFGFVVFATSLSMAVLFGV